MFLFSDLVHFMIIKFMKTIERMSNIEFKRQSLLSQFIKSDSLNLKMTQFLVENFSNFLQSQRIHIVLAYCFNTNFIGWFYYNTFCLNKHLDITIMKSIGKGAAVGSVIESWVQILPQGSGQGRSQGGGIWGSEPKY